MILQSPIFSGSVQISGSIVLNDGPISATANIVSSSTIVDTFTSSTSKVVNHGFDTKNVFVQVYNNSDELINPGSITTTDTNNVTITFPSPVTGRVIVGRSGHLVSGSSIAQSVEFDNILNKPALVSGSLDFVNITNKPDLVSGSNIASASVATTAVSASISEISKRVQAGTSGSRDLTTPQSGSLWYNTNTGNLEVYNGASGSGWAPVDTTTPTGPIVADWLVLAGGGGGGFDNAGGGGAGGLRTSYGSASGGGATSEDSITLTSGATYTITVGAGGTAAGSTDGDTTGPFGEPGNDSELSGAGISTITSTGGGEGGSSASDQAGSGGCGGGEYGNGTPTATSGTAGQGYAGGENTAKAGGGGGGGGTGAVGGNSSTTSGANGGVGTIVNILSSTNATAASVGEVSSTDVYYGGGGAGGFENSTTGNSYGGLGGGGDSQGISSNSAGAANTGGGGAGGTHSGNGGKAGGSGVVILRLPTNKYTGIYTGASVSVYTEDTDTVMVFKESGTYTA